MKTWFFNPFFHVMLHVFKHFFFFVFSKRSRTQDSTHAVQKDYHLALTQALIPWLLCVAGQYLYSWNTFHLLLMDDFKCIILTLQNEFERVILFFFIFWYFIAFFNFYFWELSVYNPKLMSWLGCLFFAALFEFYNIIFLLIFWVFHVYLITSPHNIDF